VFGDHFLIASKILTVETALISAVATGSSKSWLLDDLAARWYNSSGITLATQSLT
jgi:hypothetical protein